MNAPHAPQAFWRRAWLHELGVDWRGPLPLVGEPPVAASAPVPMPGQAPVPAEQTCVPAAEPAQTHAQSPAADHAPLSAQAPAPASAPVPALAPAPPQLPPVAATLPAEVVAGAWRWSWWWGPSGPVMRALVLRPADAPQATDAQARELLAAALQAVGLAPQPRSQGGAAGVCEGVGIAALKALIQAGQVAPTQPLPVIWCLPVPRQRDVAHLLANPGAVPGSRWPLPGITSWQLVLIPAPEDMLQDPGLKRVAWQALAPLRIPSPG